MFNCFGWLRSTLSHQHTCFDDFENTTTTVGEAMAKILNASLQLTSNAIDMINVASEIVKNSGKCCSLVREESLNHC